MPAYLGISRTLTQYRQAPFTGGQLAQLFNVLNLPGLQLWLDASQLTGFSSGDPITSLVEFSGNGRTFTGGVTQTTYQTNSTPSGKPSIRNVVSGNSGTLVAPVVTSSFLSASAFTIICVGRLTSAPNSFQGASPYNNAAFIADGTSDTGFGLVVANDPIASSYIWDGAAKTAPFAITVGTFYTLVMMLSGGSLVLRINGAQVASSAAGNIANLTHTPHLFKNYDESLQMDGDIAEMVICNQALSAGNLASVEAYERAKYGHY
jgi:hypothetical protein